MTAVDRLGFHLRLTLEILRPGGDQLGAPQATSNQDCENRPVTLAREALGRLFLQQTSRLLDRQPVANPDAQPFRTFHAADAGR
jgi:hypothetical protein